MLRRFLTVGFALVLAVFGTGAVVVYARTSEPRAAVTAERPEVRVEQAPVAEAQPLTVPDGKFAVSIEVPAARQAGGNVLAGSEVSVFAVLASANREGEAKPAPATRLLLARVPVVAVGTGAFAPATTQKPGALVTLALTQPEVERLLQAGATGTLHLALLSATTKPAVGPGVDAATLFAIPDASPTP